MASLDDSSNTTSMRWLPDPRVAPHAKAIEERVGKFAGHIRAATFAEYLDPLMRRLMADCLRDADAHEGVVWLIDREGKIAERWTGVVDMKKVRDAVDQAVGTQAR